MAVSRITQTAVNRMYNRNFSRNLTSMNDMMNKIAAQRKFTRASENPIAAARALSVRKSMADVETYNANLKTAKGIFQTAEGILREDVSGQVDEVQTKLEMAINKTYSQEQLNILAHEFRTVADNLVKSMNADYADRQLFGGTNNSSLAFTTEKDASGRTIVSYNGVDVNSSTDPDSFPSSQAIYADIGLGLQYDAAGDILPDSAMDISLNGAELTGCGEGTFTDEEGTEYTLSNNYIQLIYDMADSCEGGETMKLNAMLGALDSAHSTMLIGITNIGIQESSIEYNETRLEEYNYNLSEAQLTLEGMSEKDLAAAITEFGSISSAYNAVLSMGTKVIPNSIWDFL